jgi:uncharacterized OB-fold protein
MSDATTLELLAEDLLATPSVPAPGTVVSLAASACTACGRHEFPSRDSCPSCGGRMMPSALSTSARVAGFTAVNHPPPGAQIDTPYVIAVGAFPEGVSIMGTVVGAAIDELNLGDGLETVALEVGGRIGYGFRLTGVREP